MEQMIPINYVGHGGTYDQQDEIDGVKTIEFSTTLGFSLMLQRLMLPLKSLRTSNILTGKGRQ
jgi:hypothetical protein